MASKKSGKCRLKAVVVESGEASGPCGFCHRDTNDEVGYGKLYSIGNIYSHYYCALLSCCLVQRGDDDVGLLGFLYRDIQAEILRGKKHRCSFCSRTGATLGCSVKQCKKQFHLPCGRERNAVSLFCGTYKSYCEQHAPRQQIADDVMERVKERQQLERKRGKSNGGSDESSECICVICCESVRGAPHTHTFWPPCCARDMWLHRSCLERMTLSAGAHYLKCPLCNDKPRFYREVLSQGYYVPDRDAAWELEGGAFSEQYSRRARCVAEPCQCPAGRDQDDDEGPWDIRLCLLCGGAGCHAACAPSAPRYVCATCAPAVKDGPEMDKLEKALADELEREQAAARRAVTHGPIMPSRMSIRRTKGAVHKGPQCKPEMTPTEEPAELDNTTISRLELNLKTPKHRHTNLAPNTLGIETKLLSPFKGESPTKPHANLNPITEGIESKFLSPFKGESPPKPHANLTPITEYIETKLLSPFKGFAPPKPHANLTPITEDIETKFLSPYKGDASGSPVKYLQRMLSLDSKMAEKLRRKFKKPRPLKVKREMIIAIYNAFLNDASRSYQLTATSADKSGFASPTHLSGGLKYKLVFGQETELLKQNSVFVKQENNLVDQETKLVEQETKLIEHETKLVEQETQLIEQETKLVEQETKLVEQGSNKEDLQRNNKEAWKHESKPFRVEKEPEINRKDEEKSERTKHKEQGDEGRESNAMKKVQDTLKGESKTINRDKESKTINRDKESKTRNRDKESKTRNRDKEESKTRNRDKEESKTRNRYKEKSKTVNRYKEESRMRNRDKEESKTRNRDKETSKTRNRDNETSKARNRDKETSKTRNRYKEVSKTRNRDKEKSRTRSRDKDPSMKHDDEQSREFNLRSPRQYKRVIDEKLLEGLDDKMLSCIRYFERRFFEKCHGSVPVDARRVVRKLREMWTNQKSYNQRRTVVGDMIKDILRSDRKRKKSSKRDTTPETDRRKETSDVENPADKEAQPDNKDIQIENTEPLNNTVHTPAAPIDRVKTLDNSRTEILDRENAGTEILARENLAAEVLDRDNAATEILDLGNSATGILDLDESTTSSFELPPEFITESLSDDDDDERTIEGTQHIHETPKKSNRYNSSENLFEATPEIPIGETPKSNATNRMDNVVTLIEPEKDINLLKETPKKSTSININTDSSLEISEQNERVNIVHKHETPVDLKASCEFTFVPANENNAQCKRIIDLESFKNTYLSEVGQCGYKHKHDNIGTVNEVKTLKTAIDFAKEAAKLKEDEGERKLEKRKTEDKEEKRGGKKRKLSLKRYKKEKLQIKVVYNDSNRLKENENTINLTIESNEGEGPKRKKKKYKNISIRNKNTKVKIQWKTEKQKKKKKLHIISPTTYKQTVLSFSGERVISLTPMKKKREKKIKSENSFKQTSIHSFFAVKSPE